MKFISLPLQNHMSALNPFKTADMICRFVQFLLWFSAIGIGFLGYAFLIEPSRLVVRHVEFVSDKYVGPDLRIGLVTDIHINSAHVPPGRVSDIVARLNLEAPDIVLMPGDFIAGHDKAENRKDEFNQNAEKGLSYLGQLSMPAYATIGNHDAWWSATRVTKHLNDAGVVVLENKAINTSGLCLVGLGDYSTSQADRSAYDQCQNDLPVLIITHSPDAWRSFRRDAILAFAGHTHGGQVNLPIIGRRVNSTQLAPEHSYGFSTLGGVDIFVSAGVGTSILPIRFRAPPEVVIITLKASTYER